MRDRAKTFNQNDSLTITKYPTAMPCEGSDSNSAKKNPFRPDGNKKLFNYSTTALNRIWKAVRFSWWMTTLMHEFPETKEFDRKIKISELEHLAHSNFAQAHFAENYVGIPL